MKRISFGLIIITALIFLSSCSFIGMKDNDEILATTEMENLLVALDARDKDALLDLFAKDALDDVNDMDASVESLFEFYQGYQISNEWYSQGESGTAEYGKIMMITTLGYKVVTNEKKYIITLESVTTDTENPDNVGIHAIYIMIDYMSDLRQAYWGDGTDSPGIFIDLDFT